eukprot:TRINITY_DN25985_c0_g1_i1.p2 TRINITY_DN25985_c0_g1~~TRINITY_DN25985_c0_g1_i1.p2  ORF type:complete len:216 (-),score=21.39 TRINITY_DN25985_c0_g1_i1:71-718(-)
MVEGSSLSLRSQFLSFMDDGPPLGFHHRNVAACLVAAQEVNTEEMDFTWERAVEEIGVLESVGMLHGTFSREKFVRRSTLYTVLAQTLVNNDSTTESHKHARYHWKRMREFYASEYCLPFKWAPDFGAYFFNRAAILHKLSPEYEYFNRPLVAFHLSFSLLLSFMPAQFFSCYCFQYSELLLMGCLIVFWWVMVLFDIKECLGIPLWFAQVVVAV